MMNRNQWLLAALGAASVVVIVTIIHDESATQAVAPISISDGSVARSTPAPTSARTGLSSLDLFTTSKKKAEVAIANAKLSPEDLATVNKLFEGQLAKDLVMLNATADWYPIYQSLRKTLLTGDRAEIDRLFTELGECSWEPDEPWDKELTARTCQLLWLFSKYAFSDRVSVQIRGAARDTLGLFAKAADRISPSGVTYEMRQKLGLATGNCVFWYLAEEPDAKTLLPWEGIRTFSEYWQKYQLWATDPDYGKPVSAAK